jgi:predicted nuclease of predicted toxin-antitoxin system
LTEVKKNAMDAIVDRALLIGEPIHVLYITTANWTTRVSSKSADHLTVKFNVSAMNSCESYLLEYIKMGEIELF